jgi:hypothetical protein
MGAIQLDKELKILMDFFNKDARKPMRHKFARLSQISTILNLEKVLKNSI